MQLVCLLVLCWLSRSQTFTMTASPTTVNTQAAYALSIVDNGLTSNTGTIRITFPAAQFAIPVASAVTCVSTVSAGTTYSCSFLEANVLSITYASTGLNYLQVTLSSVRNPPSTDDTTFGYSFTLTNNNVLSSKTYTYRGYTPASLVCSIAYSINRASALTQAVFTLTNTNTIPDSGRITLQFPSTWTYSSSSSSTPLAQGVPVPQTYRKVSGSNLQNSVTPVVLGQQITLISVITGSTPPGTTLSFAISHLIAPPVAASIYTFTLSTMNSAGSLIDQSQCSIPPVVTAGLTNLATDINQSQLQVGANSPLSFSFISPVDIVSNDLMLIGPSPSAQASLAADQLGVMTFSSNSVICSGTLNANKTASFVLTSSSQTFTANSLIQLTSGLSITPLLASGTISLSITFIRSSYSFASGSLTLTIDPNRLNSVTVTPLIRTVAVSTSYSFQVTLTNPVDSTASITVTLPSEIDPMAGPCTSTVVGAVNLITQLSASSTCSIETSKMFRVSQFLTASLPAATALRLTISSIRNPYSVSPSGTFSISTYYSTALPNIVDRSNTATVTATAALITSVTVTSSSAVVRQPSIYRIVYTVKSSFLSNSDLILTFPSEIVPSSTLSYSFNFNFPNGTSTSSQLVFPSESFSTTPKTVTYSSLTAVQLPAGTQIGLNLDKLSNPDSLKQSSSFGIKQSSSGLLIESLSQTITVTNTQANLFTSVYDGTSAKVNGAATILTIFLQNSVALVQGDILSLKIANNNDRNTQYTLQSPISTCTLLGTASVAITCSRISSYELQIEFGEVMLTSSVYRLSFGPVMLPRTFAAPSSIQVASFRSSGGQLYAISSTTIQPTLNSVENAIKSIVLTMPTIPSELNTLQALSLSVVVSNPLYSGDYMIVDVPASFLYALGSSVTAASPLVLSDSLCQSSSGLYCSNSLGSVNQIKIQEITPGTFSGTTSFSVELKANVFRSPITFSFGGAIFRGSTFSATNLRMDITNSQTDLTQAVFYVSCGLNLATYHCKTCLISGICLSCYLSSSGYTANVNYDGYNFLLNGKCESNCGIGFFSQGNSCTGCASSCKTCITNAYTCTSCDQTSTFNKFDASLSQCAQNCPPTTYPDTSNMCQPCSVNCAACKDVSSKCTSCSSPLFLDKNLQRCVSDTQCPTNTLALQATRTCATCDLSCQGCYNSLTDCLTCSPGYRVDSSRLVSGITVLICTNTCPAGKVYDIPSLSCKCSSLCLTCSQTIGSCTSCDSLSGFPILLNSNCIAVCPVSTYYTGTTCQSCGDSKCQSCPSGVCSQCISPYYLSKGLCLSQCPNGAVSTVSGGIRGCEQCGAGCQSCQNGASQCSTCFTGYYKESNPTATYCTLTCSIGNSLFNNSVCLSTCPANYSVVGGNCVANQPIIVPKGRIVPFPTLISLCVMILIVGLSKLSVPQTLLAPTFAATTGAIEVISWIVLLATALQQSTVSSSTLLNAASALVVISLIWSTILGVINLTIFLKRILSDSVFVEMAQRNFRRVTLGKCMLFGSLYTSTVLSPKLTLLLFSNLAMSKLWSYKVSSVNMLYPVTVISLLCAISSVLAISGSACAGYDSQNQPDSQIFLQALDTCLVSVVSVICSLWSACKRPADYEDAIEIIRKEHTQDAIYEAEHKHTRQNDMSEAMIDDSNFEIKGSQVTKRRYNLSNSNNFNGNDEANEEPLRRRLKSNQPLNRSSTLTIGVRQSHDKASEESSQATIDLGLTSIMPQLPVRPEFAHLTEEEKAKIQNLQSKLTKEQLGKMPLLNKYGKTDIEKLWQIKEEASQDEDDSERPHPVIATIANPKGKLSGQQERHSVTQTKTVKGLLHTFSKKQIGLNDYFQYRDIKDRGGTTNNEPSESFADLFENANNTDDQNEEDLSQVIQLSPHKRSQVKSPVRQAAQSNRRHDDTEPKFPTTAVQLRKQSNHTADLQQPDKAEKPIQRKNTSSSPHRRQNSQKILSSPNRAVNKFNATSPQNNTLPHRSPVLHQNEREQVPNRNNFVIHSLEDEDQDLSNNKVIFDGKDKASNQNSNGLLPITSELRELDMGDDLVYGHPQRNQGNAFTRQNSQADYETVLSRQGNNDKIKQLQKIYLARLDTKHTKRRRTMSRTDLS